MSVVTATQLVRRPAGLLNLKADLLGLCFAVAVAVAIPFATRDAALLSILAVMFIWMGVNASWNLVLGFAGTFSFGQIAFFGVGAYTSTILNVHERVSPWLGTFAAAAVAGLAAFFIGLVVLRLRGVYVALFTLSFHQLLNTFVANDYSGFTGGPNGLFPTPYFQTSSLLDQSLIGYWIGLGGALLVIVSVLLLVRCPVGLALVAARDAEHVATARGVTATRYRMIAFVFSGAAAGLMGAVYAHFIGVVSPTIFSFGIMMMLLSMIIIGGWGTVWGPIVGTAAITYLTQWLQGRAPQYQSLILATILLFAILFLRGGIVGAAQAGLSRVQLYRQRGAWQSR